MIRARNTTSSFCVCWRMFSNALKDGVFVIIDIVV
jgi:hypothetical protein